MLDDADLETLAQDSISSTYRARRQSHGAAFLEEISTKTPGLAPRLAHQGEGRCDRLKQAATWGATLDLAVPTPFKLVESATEVALIMHDPGGLTLQTMLEAVRLDLKNALQITRAIAKALAKLAEHGLVHEDLAPQSVLVRDPQSVSLLRLAWITREGDASSLDAETPEGTLAYLSPERTGRTGRIPDHRADLYSLGALLYEMTTGAPPFVHTDKAALVFAHLAEQPRPPHEVKPAVPGVVSAIVMKLLAKSPDDRYQSAASLLADLEACLEDLQKTDAIAPFPLGRGDRLGRLAPVQTLYGRHAEQEALVSALQRAQRGGRELLLIEGATGLGKSALVLDTAATLGADDASFVTGKFVELARTPYAGLGHALRELVQQALAEPEHVLVSIRRDLARALGPNAALLSPLAPELLTLLGPLAEAPDLGPIESKNRFTHSVQRFIEIFTQRRPLVLFLDDLQWADPASLTLVGDILTNSSASRLLIIGAARSDEIHEGHALRLLLRNLDAKGVARTSIELGPLSPSEVKSLVAGALGFAPDDVRALSAFLWRKTAGNPFFIGQLLKALVRQRALGLDTDTGAVRLDETDLADTLSGNILELLVERLRKLDPKTQRALAAAAAIGHTFPIEILAAFGWRSVEETRSALAEAVHEHLLLPIGTRSRANAPENSREAGSLPTHYRFLHDRVQQAAYSLLPEEERPSLHLAIGRLLRDARKPDTDEGLFEVLYHLTRGASLLVDPDERVETARLCFLSGRKAKSTAAYEAAAALFATGFELLGDRGFDDHHELTFSLGREHAFCAYMNGRTDEADALFERLLERAASKLERVSILNLRSVLCVTQGRFVDAVNAGRKALALLGLSIPEDEAGYAAAFASEQSRMETLLEGRRIEDLVQMPASEDPELRAALRTLMHLVSPAYCVSGTLLALLCTMLPRISLERGYSDVSAFGFVAYGVVLGGRRAADAFAFGKLALAVHERFPSPDLTAKVHLTFGGNLYFGGGPLRAALPHLERAIRDGLASGDYLFVAYACFQTATVKLVLGDDLAQVEKDIEGLLQLVQKTKDALSEAVLRICLQLTRALLGRTNSPTTLSDADFDEARFTEDMVDKGILLATCFAHVARLALSVLSGDLLLAEELADAAEKLMHAAPAQVFATELWYYGAFVAAALSQEGTPEEKERRKAAFTRREAELALLAEGCAGNYHHKLLLVRAERARAEGRDKEATALYEEAIEVSSAHAFSAVEALANERAASSLLERGAKRASRPYLDGALAAYERWGARTKIKELSALHTALFEHAPPPASAARTALAMTATSAPVETATLDAATVIQTAQAIAGELELGSVLERIMRGVLQSSGAQRGVLLLERDGTLYVEATMDMGQRGFRHFRQHGGVPVEESDELPPSVVDYVRRTKEPLLLGEAMGDRRFAKDRYFAERGARSVLCAPMLHKGELVGILYGEHSAAHNAFTRARLELVVFLASQAAAVVKNALLYAEVHQISEELKRSNETLEAEVSRRTRELAGVAEMLKVELEERARAEGEREALQAQIIAAQRERIVELSAPIIPITNDVVVMPIIGAIDKERAAEMQQRLLRETSNRRARVVILDVTGIKEGGAAMAEVLVQAAAALRLIGARTVLTGIRPEIATALITSGVGLSGLTTKGSLRDGIALALRA